MDLRGQSKIKHFWSYDEDLDEVTITFKTDDELTVLGDIIIEGKKFRSMFEPFAEVGLKFFPNLRNLLDRQFQRTNFDTRDGVAITEFNP